MWAAVGTNLKMAEGDYGVPIVFSIKNVEFSGFDSIRLTVKDTVNGTGIFTKTISDLSGNTFQIMLTSAESALIPVGEYVYALDWYINDVFLCNLVPVGLITVLDKV